MIFNPHIGVHLKGGGDSYLKHTQFSAGGLYGYGSRDLFSSIFYCKEAALENQYINFCMAPPTVYLSKGEIFFMVCKSRSGF